MRVLAIVVLVFSCFLAGSAGSGQSSDKVNTDLEKFWTRLKMARPEELNDLCVTNVTVVESVRLTPEEGKDDIGVRTVGLQLLDPQDNDARFLITSKVYKRSEHASLARLHRKVAKIIRMTYFHSTGSSVVPDDIPDVGFMGISCKAASNLWLYFEIERNHGILRIRSIRLGSH